MNFPPAERVLYVIFLLVPEVSKSLQDPSEDGRFSAEAPRWRCPLHSGQHAILVEAVSRGSLLARRVSMSNIGQFVSRVFPKV